MASVELHTFLVGLNHETAPLQVRERAAFDLNSSFSTEKEALGHAGLDGAVFVSTCNRSEIYFVSDRAEPVLSWLSAYCEVEVDRLKSHVYILQDSDVFEHAARVASGMNSMVLGETQIFGQMKDAFRRAKEFGVINPRLSRLFESAFGVAKRIRNRTEIGSHSISLASVAYKTAGRIFSELQSKRVLFIGAGEMIGLTAEYFTSRGLSDIAFCNRTRTRADLLTEKFGGLAFDLELLERRVAEFDVIVSCTGSQRPILSFDLMRRVTLKRKHQPLLIFDLAVPRDTDPLVQDLDDIFLYSVDDLGLLVRDGIGSRFLAISEAEVILKRGAVEFENSLENEKVVLDIKAFREFGEAIATSELEKALALLKVGRAPEDILRSLTRNLKNKLLDKPSRQINNATASDKRALSRSLRVLFDLGEQE